MAGDKATPILQKSSTHTGVMRGRDVHSRLNGKGIDPILVATMADIAEINHVNVKAIAEIATMLDECVNLIQQFSDVAGNMKDRTDQMARAMGQTAEGDDSGETSN